MSESSGHDRGLVGVVGVDVTCILGRDGGRGEPTIGILAGGHQLIVDIRNGEDLLGLGIVGHAQVMNQIDTQDVVVQMITDQKCA